MVTGDRWYSDYTISGRVRVGAECMLYIIIYKSWWYITIAACMPIAGLTHYK